MLCDEKFRFSDGRTGKKLFVILNAPKANEPYLVLKTTSNPQLYKNVKSGCNPKRFIFFVPLTEGEKFAKDTYIQLNEIFTYTAGELVRGSMVDKTLRSVISLSPQRFGELKNCLKQIKNDISEEHYNMIFRK